MKHRQDIHESSSSIYLSIKNEPAFPYIEAPIHICIQFFLIWIYGSSRRSITWLDFSNLHAGCAYLVKCLTNRCGSMFISTKPASRLPPRMLQLCLFSHCQCQPAPLPVLFQINLLPFRLVRESPPTAIKEREQISPRGIVPAWAERSLQVAGFISYNWIACKGYLWTLSASSSSSWFSARKYERNWALIYDMIW